MLTEGQWHQGDEGWEETRHRRHCHTPASFTFTETLLVPPGQAVCPSTSTRGSFLLCPTQGPRSLRPRCGARVCPPYLPILPACPSPRHGHWSPVCSPWGWGATLHPISRCVPHPATPLKSRGLTAAVSLFPGIRALAGEGLVCLGLSPCRGGPSSAPSKAVCRMREWRESPWSRAEVSPWLQ